MQPTFFYEMDWDRWAKDQRQQPIEKTSAYVIYKFASWQSDEPDELDSVTDNIDFNNINQRYLGVRHFIEHGRAKK